LIDRYEAAQSKERAQGCEKDPAMSRRIDKKKSRQAKDGGNL
jgi:hypothetical protein